MTDHLTASLFDDEPAPARRLSAALTRTAGASPQQRKFQQLLAQVARRREQLEQWRACDLRHHQRVIAEVGPRLARMRALRTELVGLIDAVLAEPRKGGRQDRSQSARLRAWLRQLIDLLDPEGLERDLDAVRNRHQCVPISERERRDQARLLQAVTQAFAPAPAELQRLAALSCADLLDYAARRLQDHLLRAVQPAFVRQLERGAQLAAKQAARREAARAAKRDGVQAERERGRAQAGQSLREVYRRLAMALHPDREPDPAQRARKTELIQRVNQAYEAGDLLTLLGLQFETEQIDAAGLAALSEQKLAHFGQLLREQLASLDLEIDGVAERLREAIELPAWQALTPQLIDRQLNSEIALIDLALLELQDDLLALRNPAARRARLARLQAEESPEASGDLDDLLTLLEQFAPTAQRKRRR